MDREIYSTKCWYISYELLGITRTIEVEIPKNYEKESLNLEPKEERKKIRNKTKRQQKY